MQLLTFELKVTHLPWQEHQVRVPAGCHLLGVHGVGNHSLTLIAAGELHQGNAHADDETRSIATVTKGAHLPERTQRYLGTGICHGSTVHVFELGEPAQANAAQPVEHQRDPTAAPQGPELPQPAEASDSKAPAALQPGESEPIRTDAPPAEASDAEPDQ